MSKLIAAAVVLVASLALASSANATVGKTTIGSGTDYMDAGWPQDYPAVATATEQENRLSIYLASNNAATKVTLGLYSGNSTTAKTLLKSCSITNPVNGAWNRCAITAQSVTQGTQYWVAALGTGGALRFANSSSGKTVQSSKKNLTALPANWTNGQTFNGYTASLYADQTGSLAPPTAGFTFSPANPATGQQVTFDSSSSTCSATPCTYAWQDDGPDGLGGTNWPLGSGQTLQYTFSGAGTKYVRLTVTDAQNRTATVEHDVVVSSQPPPTPQCSDGTDNDGDGLTDYPSDPGCTSASDDSESPNPPPADTTPPTVSVTMPLGGSTLSGTANLAADASDDVAVDHVTFRVDGNSVGSDSTAPYSTGYDTSQVANGSHTVTALAVDTSGNATVSDPVSVTVDNQGPPPPGPCDLHATTSNFASVWNSADGKVVCLASGNYGTLGNAPMQKSAMTTIRPEDGANVTMGVNFNYPASNITLDGLNMPGAQLLDAHDITIKNSTFDQAQLTMRVDMLPHNANILIDHDVFSNYVKCSSCYEGRVSTEGATSGPDGITIQNSTFFGGNSDGVQLGGAADKVLNNEFYNIIQQGTAVHADAIQLVGPGGHTISGNYIHDTSDGIMAADGMDHETITNNVFNVTGGLYASDFVSDNGSVIKHNTFSGAGGGGVLYLGNKDQDPVSTGTVLKDNIFTRACVCSGSTPQNQTEDYNLVADGSGTGSHDIAGAPTYVGGAHPTTRAGFALTSSSLGHLGADDGTDIGANP